jgi:hypothetical protein
MAIIINLDGTTTHRAEATHRELYGPEGMTLEAMQAAVGGYIEHIFLIPPYVCSGVSYPHMVMNELGKLEGLPCNDSATDIAVRRGLLPGDYIAGVAILLEKDEMQ